MRIFDFLIFRSQEGDMGSGRTWVCCHRMWMYNGEKRRAGENIQNADSRCAEERERFITLLLDTAQRWDIYAAANQEHPERVVHGLAAGSVCLDLATEVRSWTERPEPTPEEPSVEPESE